MRAQPTPDSRRSWLLLGVLVAGYIGVYLCRKNYAVAVPLLREEFGATKEEIGRIASVGTLAYAIGKMVLCPLADRFGGRRCFFASLLVVAGFGLASALAPTLGALAMVYAFNRFGGSIAWASMVKQVPPWFGPKNLALALAVLSLSYVFGGAAAVALAGVVADASGQSWRAVMGVPSVFVLLLVSALSFSLTLVRETFNDWTVDFIRTEGGAHLSTSVAAFLSTPFDLCGAGGILFVGAMMGRLSVRGRARLLAGSLFALCAVLLVLPRLVPLGLGFTVPAVGLIGFLSLGPYSLLAGYFAVQLRGEACAGTVAGIVDSLGYVAGLLAGSAFGWLLDRGGYALGFYVLAGISLVSAVIALSLEVKAPARLS
ncbi:MAG: MFS transporter [Mycobacteriaceae bacterium]|nr:MFS transporter [Mycobacteriaceae bacterium]